jgi:hypothetical protein
MLLIHTGFNRVESVPQGALNRFNGFRIFVGAETVKTVMFFSKLTTRLETGCE